MATKTVSLHVHVSPEIRRGLDARVEKARAVGAITVPHTLRGFVLKAIQAYTPTFDRMLQHEMNKAQKGEQVEYEDLAAKPSPAPKNGPIALGGRD